MAEHIAAFLSVATVSADEPYEDLNAHLQLLVAPTSLFYKAVQSFPTAVELVAECAQVVAERASRQKATHSLKAFFDRATAALATMPSEPASRAAATAVRLNSEATSLVKESEFDDSNPLVQQLAVWQLQAAETAASTLCEEFWQEVHPALTNEGDAPDKSKTDGSAVAKTITKLLQDSRDGKLLLAAVETRTSLACMLRDEPGRDLLCEGLEDHLTLALEQKNANASVLGSIFGPPGSAVAVTRAGAFQAWRMRFAQKILDDIINSGGLADNAKALLMAVGNSVGHVFLTAALLLRKIAAQQPSPAEPVDRSLPEVSLENRCERALLLQLNLAALEQVRTDIPRCVSGSTAAPLLLEAAASMTEEVVKCGQMEFDGALVVLRGILTAMAGSLNLQGEGRHFLALDGPTLTDRTRAEHFVAPG